MSTDAQAKQRQMRNLRMAEKIAKGEAIDISSCERNKDGDYILKRFVGNVDYCDGSTEEWIWSIGRDRQTGEILASTTTKFYQNPSFECLFLR